MGFIQVSGLAAGIIAVLAGIVVIAKPKILAWVVGISFIVFGIFAILSALNL